MASPLALKPPPIYALLGYRTELELTSVQVSALDSIAQLAQEENRTLVRQLREHSSERSRQSGAIIVTGDGAPILEEIRANQRQAGEAVAEVLSEDQRVRVCELFDRRRGRTVSNVREPGPRSPGEPRAGEPRIVQPAGWGWCATSSDREERAAS